MPSPTASKVAKIGERKPYNAPPRTLARMPRTSQRMMAAGRHKHRKNFKICPICLALKKNKESDKKSLTAKERRRSCLVTSLLNRKSKRSERAKDLV